MKNMWETLLDSLASNTTGLFLAELFGSWGFILSMGMGLQLNDYFSTAFASGKYFVTTFFSIVGFGISLFLVVFLTMCTIVVGWHAGKYIEMNSPQTNKELRPRIFVTKIIIGNSFLLLVSTSTVIDGFTGTEITIWETLSRAFGGGGGLIFLGSQLLQRNSFWYFRDWQRMSMGFLMILVGLIFVTIGISELV